MGVVEDEYEGGCEEMVAAVGVVVRVGLTEGWDVCVRERGQGCW